MPRALRLLLDPLFLFEEPNDAGHGAAVADPPDGEVAPDPPEGDLGPGDGEQAPSETDDGFEPPFKMEDVPEAYRQYVEPFVQQTRDAWLRKTNELAEVRRTLEAEGASVAEAKALMARLEDEDQVEDVINELAEKYDLELIDESTGQPIKAPAPAPEGDNPLAADVEALKAAEARREAERESQGIRNHVFDGIERYREKIGIPEGEMPKEVSDQLISNALALPLKDGKPDIDLAVQNWERAEQAVIDRYKASKDVDPPDLSGSSGVEAIDTSTPEGRRKKANAVAARAHAAASAS